jgi:hypothetical protein
MYAYCNRSGVIGFGRKIPEGYLLIMKGPARKLREEINIAARHGYEKGILLVPGVPEADSEYEALEALFRFKQWLKKSVEW